MKPSLKTLALVVVPIILAACLGYYGYSHASDFSQLTLVKPLYLVVLIALVLPVFIIPL